MKKNISAAIAAILVSLLLAGCSIASSAAPAVSSVSVPENSISVYFPRAGQNAEEQLIAEMNTARETLDVAIYSFTDTKIANAIVSAKKRGATVRMISDRESSGNTYQKQCLAVVKNAGIPIKINSHSGIMHLKVTIIDKKEATTGSFNYTKSAQKENDENLVLIKNEAIAQTYENEFSRMWNDPSGYKDY